MERPVPPYEGGKGDDNFAIYQANKEAWRAKHLHEKVIFPLQQELKLENYTRRIKIVKEFNENLLGSLPYIMLSFRPEFPDYTKDALGSLLPTDYRKLETDNIYDWRYNVKVLLDSNIGNKIPGLRERVDEICETPAKKQAFEDGANRAVNNFLYSIKENLEPPKESTPAYKKEFKEFLKHNRNNLVELIECQNTHKIKVCLDYMWAVFRLSPILEPRYPESKDLMRHQVSKEIRAAIKADRLARKDPVLRKKAADFVIDELFNDFQDIEEIQD